MRTSQQFLDFYVPNQRTCLWYVWCTILWCKLYIFPFCCDFMISSHWAPVWVFVASLGLSATVSRVGQWRARLFVTKTHYATFRDITIRNMTNVTLFMTSLDIHFHSEKTVRKNFVLKPTKCISLLLFFNTLNMKTSFKDFY